jgi:hypothetical protein
MLSPFSSLSPLLGGQPQRWRAVAARLGQIIGLLVNTPITITCARSAPKRPRSVDHIAARRARRAMNHIRSLD